MKITDIYTKYKIPKNLQEHQLRVAAVAWQVCDALRIEVEQDLIVRTALVHDMGNIVKFDWQTIDYPELSADQDYWKKVQEDFREKYGTEDHEATQHILKELGLSNRILQLAGGTKFHLICNHRDGIDMGAKILFYADARVGPYGILSYEERMEESRKRYENRKGTTTEAERRRIVDCGKDIEDQIFELSTASPEEITDESVKPYIEKLKEFEF